MMSESSFKAGKALGSKHLAHIRSKGSKWRERNVPIFIRQQLLVPWFTTEADGYEVLHVIQVPISPGEKVHFIEFARRRLPDEGSSEVFSGH